MDLSDAIVNNRVRKTKGNQLIMESKFTEDTRNTEATNATKDTSVTKYAVVAEHREKACEYQQEDVQQRYGQTEEEENQLPVPLAGSRKTKEHLYKILVIGDLGTGKTSINQRYVHQFFSQHYRATIGVDFALKVLNWDAQTFVRLQLWDIAGQERFGNMTRVYYKDAAGAFVVFDVTREPTLEASARWKKDLDGKVRLPDGSHVPCLLLANKCDQTKEGIADNPEQMEEFCKENGFIGWYETSAKENINIDEAANFLVTQILQNDLTMDLNQANDKGRIALNGTATGRSGIAEKKSCC